MKVNIRYGKLLTIKKITKRIGNPYKPETWLCKCDCGNEKIVSEHYLNTSPQPSCGCYLYKSKRIYNRKDYFELIKNIIINKTERNENNCWIWKGAMHKQGYGYLRFKMKNQLVHRICWIIFKGDIPEDMKVCHRCDTPQCCNPDHLFIGTQKDNMLDRKLKGKYEKNKYQEK